MRLKQSWRWFGPNDPVSLQDVKQTGATGIVTALHHVPHGAVWTVDAIEQRKKELAAYGFNWDVVESLSIHEDIKTRSGNYLQYVENYKVSLRNIAACGIPVVTYNFMPVNDWTRTDIAYRMHDNSKALNFNWTDLAIFDIYLLKRANAAAAYPEAIVQRAASRFAQFTQLETDTLVDTVLFGIPGEERRSVDAMRKQLAAYDDINHATLKSNMAYFLQQVAPVATEVGVKLAVHPDDPPFDILGLPRIVSTHQDLLDVLSAAPEPANGICFCTGSLGANPVNDLPAMIKALDTRIHFVHLRNTKRDAEGNFYEADHLDGDTDMYAVMRELLTIQQKLDTSIPFRPDHGHQMLDDMDKITNPGYSAIGRLRGLAELRGLELGVLRSMGWE
ncbi:mannonate dehydratase [Deminuibacter soli]|uniref:Mannonate dehydratase n=1 Tax=Deminuibacter soli TaxID=2291815 RepID=A0A3E1ND56_9BACT|nr:mannonate dehydratase [Deminuibacter soli]RFM25870.1 mannonate dehydratase [Deminuibacter soli]